MHLARQCRDSAESSPGCTAAGSLAKPCPKDMRVILEWSKERRRHSMDSYATGSQYPIADYCRALEHAKLFYPNFVFRFLSTYIKHQVNVLSY